MSDKNRTRLDKRQTFRLTKWLEENQPKLTGTSAQVAEEASIALAFPVTKNNVQSIMGSSQECIIQHKWPSNNLAAGEGAGPDGHMPRRMVVMIRVMDIIIHEVPRVAESMTGELAELWRELSEQALLPGAPEPAPGGQTGTEDQPA